MPQPRLIGPFEEKARETTLEFVKLQAKESNFAKKKKLHAMAVITEQLADLAREQGI